MEDCCIVAGQGTNVSNECPVCHTRGKQVDLITVRSLVKNALTPKIRGGQYYFCATTSCPIVYFSGNPESHFRKEDLSVRVGMKETSDPIPVCYCFAHTKASIRHEIALMGKSTAEDHVRAEVKAGRCACEIRNPSGACCLGELHAVIQECMREAQHLTSDTKIR